MLRIDGEFYLSVGSPVVFVLPDLSEVKWCADVSSPFTDMG